MMACLALVGGLAALAAAWLVRHRRAARALLAVAIACAAAIAGIAASEMTSARAVNLAVTTLERPAGPRLRWLWPEFQARSRSRTSMSASPPPSCCCCSCR